MPDPEPTSPHAPQTLEAANQPDTRGSGCAIPFITIGILAAIFGFGLGIQLVNNYDPFAALGVAAAYGGPFILVGVLMRRGTRLGRALLVAAGAVVFLGVIGWVIGFFAGVQPVVIPVTPSDYAPEEPSAPRDAQTNLGAIYEERQDYVQADKWYILAAKSGEQNAASLRDQIEKKMTPAQIAEAKRLASEWKPVGG